MTIARPRLTPCWIIGLFLASFAMPCAAAPSNSPTGSIISFSTGFAANQSRVQADFAFYNPSSCATSDGYITDPADPGVNLYNSTLLTAYVASRRVILTVDGCYLGRPKIVGVTIVQ